MGCASETFSPDAAPEFVAARDDAPVYQLGPNQFAPPDERLDAGERVRMLRREFGYSRVLLPSGMSGYMANDDLVPALPLPPPRERSVPRERSLPDVPVFDDVPLPDLDVSPPDAPVEF